MSNILSLIKKVYPGVILLLSNVILFWQFYFRGLLPFPGDLLVSFYFPWNSGGFIGFDQWTTHKNVISADVIRQIYPWKTLAIDLLKNGQWPLWNPYNFSGTPLLANLQSSVFFPGNILFFILPQLISWVVLVVGLPLLFSIGMYLFLRVNKLSKPASVFGAIAGSSISYFLVWSEQLVIIQSALFLPFILFLIDKYRNSRSHLSVLFLSILFAFSVFGGHIQTTVYVYLIAILYLIYRRYPMRRIFSIIVFSFALAAIQLIPSLELYFQSAREVTSGPGLFSSGILPLKTLITIFAADFFGNPATNNFWGKDYGNFQAYFGISALVLAIYGVFYSWKKSPSRFWIAALVIGLVVSMWPVANIFHLLKIPVLSTGVPARAIFIFQFSATILAALGLHRALEYQQKHINKTPFIATVLLLGLVYFSLWFVCFIHPGDYVFGVAKNNLILPTAIFFLTGFLVFICLRLPKFATFAVIGLCLLSSLEYSYFFNKFQPSSQGKFVFPEHPISKYLQSRSDGQRFYGEGTAYLDNNFATYWRVYATEGYDSLYILRYGELLASAKDGSLSSEVTRSDATLPTERGVNKDRLMDLLGVRYVLNKIDTPVSNWQPDNFHFPEDKYQLIWQSGKWQAYQRVNYFPRAFLAGNYKMEKSSQAIIASTYDPTNNIRDTAILESDPQVHPEGGGIANVAITGYSANKIEIRSFSEVPKILVISDVYFPGWKATVDGRDTVVLRADYALRAISLNKGEHKIELVYDPDSFRWGIAISLVSLLGLVTICFLKK